MLAHINLRICPSCPDETRRHLAFRHETWPDTSWPHSRLESGTLGPIVTPTVTGRIALLHRSVYRSQRRTVAVSGVAFANATADFPDNKKAKMAGSDATTRVVVWFRNDLRLQDNYAVKQAESIATRTAGCDVLPLYVFDPRTFAPSSWGSPKCGGHRGRFQLESVLNLKKNLRAVGSDLLVAVGKPEEVIPKYLLDAPGAKNVVLTQVSDFTVVCNPRRVHQSFFCVVIRPRPLKRQ